MENDLPPRLANFLIFGDVEMGTDEHIIKPWDLKMVQERVSKCWSKFKKKEEGQ